MKSTSREQRHETALAFKGFDKQHYPHAWTSSTPYNIIGFQTNLRGSLVIREGISMPGDDSFPELMDRLRSGEDQAAREVFERFATRLMGLARRHLDGRLSVKVDPEDVVQSAYKSFFVRQREGTLTAGNWDSLWGILTMITIRKCADRAAYFRADKRDVARETSGRGDDSSPDAMAEIALDREPSPEEAVVLTETVEALFQAVCDPDERAILELSLQGYSAPEISESLGRAERSVRRLRERLRKRLERMRDD